MSIFKSPLFGQHKEKILFLVRLAVVFIFLWHGLPKALDPSAAALKFESMGFPGFLGGIVGWLEVIASIMVLAGYYHTLANGILAIIILVAILGVQLPQGVVAGLERDLLILIITLILITHGPGIAALDNHSKKE